MTIKSTFLLIPLTCALLLLTSPVNGQNQYKKRASCGKQSLTTQSVAVTKVSPKRVNIHLPPNYEPPVANDKLITFPETVATQKQQKKLLKKRKKRKKRLNGKKQGCKAASL